MEKWIWEEDIAVAILTGDDIDLAVKALVKKKREEADAYERKLKDQAENGRLLTAGLKMPEGTPGRRMAMAILSEMREDFPDAARKADENIEHRRKMNELDTEIMLRKDGYEGK